MHLNHLPLLLHFGGGSTSSGHGYFMVALIFSVLCIPCFVICFFSTKEVIGGGSKKKENAVKNLIGSFAMTFQDRNARFLILGMFCFLTGIFGRLGIMAYYFIYVMGNPMAIAVVGFIYGFTNFGGLVSYGLGAEIIDDNWIKTSRRADGVIYSCISFSTKMGNAIGGPVGIVVLAAVGFVANAELAPDVLTRMNAVINFGPCIFFALSAVFIMMIEMTNAKGKENEAIIAQKTAEN